MTRTALIVAAMVAIGAKLFIVAAGADTTVARCQPLFDAMGQKTFVIGGNPAAALCCWNLIASTCELKVCAPQERFRSRALCSSRLRSDRAASSLCEARATRSSVREVDDEVAPPLAGERGAGEQSLSRWEESPP
jgi:hypothetical protein